MFHEQINNESEPLTKALDVEGYKKKVILILGGPGMGKSTLAINICKQWAKGDLLQSYNAVILLQLRNKKIQEAKNIKELLLTINDKLRENVYSEIVKSNGMKICFILEGYDELPYDLQRSSVFADLTEELIKCTVICMSRPEAYTPFFTTAVKVIKINGFNEESVDQYISKVFDKSRNGGKLACDLKSQVHDNKLLRSILHIPINLAIVCLIFYHFSMLPKTLTELYTLLCLRLILRYINTRTDKKVEKLQSLNHLPSDISEKFLQLCCIACKGMEAKMAIFSSSDLAKFGVDESNLSDMGLLLIAPTISVGGKEKFYNFLHLTLQEFCAAWYISKRPTIEEQIKLMRVFNNQKQCKIVWRFYAGITKQWNEEIFEYMLPCKQVKSQRNDWKISELALIAYETGSSEACQIVGDYFRDSSNMINLFYFESYAINFVLTQYKGILRLFKNGQSILVDWQMNYNKDIFDQSLEDVAVQQCNSMHEFHSFNAGLKDRKLMFQALCNSKTFDTLSIGKDDLTYDDIKCLGNNTNNCLHTIKLIQCNVDSTKADIIGEMLSSNKSIKSVDLTRNCLADVGVEKLVHHLMNNDTLQSINLRSNSITEVGVGHLRKLITRTDSSLTSIDLSCNYLKDKGVDLLLHSLPMGIEHIGLLDVGMTQLSCQSLASALHKIKSICFHHVLNFEASCITCDQGQSIFFHEEYLAVINDYAKLICSNYWKAITVGLSSTAVLERLEITFTFSFNSDLLTAIGHNENIKTLKLNFDGTCYGCDDWLAKLAQTIQYSKSVTKLALTGNLKCQNSSHFIELMTTSLSMNVSIKSMFYGLACNMAYINTKETCKLIKELKENNTVEELSLLFQEKDQLSEIENCIYQINKAREIKGEANLKVNLIESLVYSKYFM